MQTQRQTEDLISLLSFLESRLKMALTYWFYAKIHFNICSLLSFLKKEKWVYENTFLSVSVALSTFEPMGIFL
jgi:hypothetical protein